MTIAIILLAAGFCLIVLEVFVPSGGLLSVLAVAAMIASIYFAFAQSQLAGFLRDPKDWKNALDMIKSHIIDPLFSVPPILKVPKELYAKIIEEPKQMAACICYNCDTFDNKHTTHSKQEISEAQDKFKKKFDNILSIEV